MSCYFIPSAEYQFCIRNAKVISGCVCVCVCVCVWGGEGVGGGAHPQHPSPRGSNVSRPDPKLTFLSEEVAISRERITS